MLTTTMALVGLSIGTVGVIGMTITGLFFFVSLGFIDIGMSALIGLIILGGMLIYKLKR